MPTLPTIGTPRKPHYWQPSRHSEPLRERLPVFDQKLPPKTSVNRAAILDALAERNLTIREIAELKGIYQSTCERLIRKLCADSIVQIVGTKEVETPSTRQTANVYGMMK